MEHWTQTAKELLEQHLNARRNAIAASGADPDEVLEDLRRHVMEELTVRKLDTVTADDVRAVLQRMGELDAPLTSDPPEETITPPVLEAVSEAKKGPKRYPFFFFFGVVLPVITLLIEAITHMCGGVFFDPIPTYWHGLLVACVPVANFFLWQLARDESASRPLWRVAGGGFAAVLSGAYALLFIPLILPAVIAIVIYGWGLLPLSPLLSMLVSARLLYLIVKRMQPTSGRVGSWLASGALAGVLALSVVNSPQWLTHYWASKVAEAQSIEEARGTLKNLRFLGHEETLLRACYRSVSGFNGFNSWGWELGARPPDQDAARRIYFQVTGRPFNSVPPPQRKYGSARWGFLDEWEWDAGHGGTAVAGRIKGLSLQQSRLDGLANPKDGWGYVEWIMEFKNTSRRDREARAQIALPPGGVVSRLTLWVNGEEREAAFAGTAKTRKAYQDVAVVQRRDPVLVTKAGRDRILMQCFPVPRDGGTIKIRMGITAPWSLLEETEAAWRLPKILERNFNLPEGVQHSVWIESPHKLKAMPGLREDLSKPGVSAIRGELTDEALSGRAGVLRARREEALAPAWAAVDLATGRKVVQQQPVKLDQMDLSRVVLVLDGAEGMEDHMPEVANALQRTPAGLELGVIVAQDGVWEFQEPRQWSGTTRDDLARRVRRLNCAGGQDNQAALLAAWDWATESPNGAVIWVHGSQPVEFDRLETLSQRLLWRPEQKPFLFDLAVETGPNRLAETPEMARLLTPVPRLDSLANDLERLINQLSGGVDRWAFQRELLDGNSASANDARRESSKHIVRLWGQDEVERLKSTKDINAAVALAAKFQLVTSVSGAVVLENMEQFERAGLQPVDSETVPTVPEPGTIALLLMALVLVVGVKSWRARSGRLRPMTSQK